MNLHPPHLNLLLAWLGVVAGFVSGMGMGLFFQRPDWLGGYGSLKRRLYRLGHISFFGLALINLMFYVTAREMAPGTAAVQAAAWLFALGAATMPVCCVLMAHQPRTQPLFAVPVVSLIAGSLLTVKEVIAL